MWPSDGIAISQSKYGEATAFAFVALKFVPLIGAEPWCWHVKNTEQYYKPLVQLSRTVSFQVKRLGIADGLISVDDFGWPSVSHLVLKCRERFASDGFIRRQMAACPSLQRLEMSVPDSVLSGNSSGEVVDFFQNLQSQCPRLEWLDVDLHFWVPTEDNGGIGPLEKINWLWPQEGQTLRVVRHHRQPEEGEEGRWLEPWRHFSGNVRVVDDPEELRESQKEMEKEWFVSPYQFFA